MNEPNFDTLKFTKTLQSSGISAEQAEAITMAFRDAAGDADLASKKDIALAVAELKTEMAGLRGEMSTMKWMMGAMGAISVANFAKQHF